MSRFVRIPDHQLKEIVAQCQAMDSPVASRIPPEYFSPVPPIRIVFWQRLRILAKLLKQYAPKAENCLDFGGGGGVFAPTLANSFSQVTLIDLGTAEARVTKNEFALSNVTLVEADATETDLGEGRFDTAVAADVLEHFQDLDQAIDPLRRWLKDDGILVTSLPTETFTYSLLRWVFRTEKPEDHYHRAVDVENHLQRRGFRKLKRCYAPLPFPLTPLFYLTAWQKQKT